MAVNEAKVRARDRSFVDYFFESRRHRRQRRQRRQRRRRRVIVICLAPSYCFITIDARRRHNREFLRVRSLFFFPSPNFSLNLRSRTAAAVAAAVAAAIQSRFAHSTNNRFGS